MYKKRYTKNDDVIKRSGYILALIDFQDVSRLNGIPIIQNDIYVFPRKPTEETEVLLCIKLNIFLKMIEKANINNIEENIEENKYNINCEYIEILKKNEYLQFINAIDTLYIKYSYIVNRILLHLIEEDWTDNYIILNIEPKGDGKLERTYPAPLITIPGGTREERDNNNFEECAFREFFEETRIDIRSSKYICLTKDKLKCSKYIAFNHFNKKNKRNKLAYRISWYYSIKLIKPEIIEEEINLEKI
jgi:hypothetical protein